MLKVLKAQDKRGINHTVNEHGDNCTDIGKGSDSSRFHSDRGARFKFCKAPPLVSSSVCLSSRGGAISRLTAVDDCIELHASIISSSS